MYSYQFGSRRRCLFISDHATSGALQHREAALLLLHVRREERRSLPQPRARVHPGDRLQSRQAVFEEQADHPVDVHQAVRA